MLNENFNLYRLGWLELVFSGRNKEYGAYDLRKGYGARMGKALFIASFVFISGACLPMIYHYYIKDTAVLNNPLASLQQQKEVVIDLMKVREVPPRKELPAGGEKVNVKTIRHVPPRVVPASRVREEMPQIQELERSVIAQTAQEGPEAGAYQNPLSTANGSGTGTGTGTGNAGEEVLDVAMVENFPEFPGGMEAFAKYLRKNLRYPGAAVDNGIEGRVFISFIVEKDGSLTDIRIIKGLGFGCDEEALRVLKKSPLWKAGIQNGQKVRVQYTLPLVFQMSQ